MDCPLHWAEGGFRNTLALWTAPGPPEWWLRHLPQRSGFLMTPAGLVWLWWGLRCVSSLLCLMPGSFSLDLRSQGLVWIEGPWETQASLWNAVWKRLPSRMRSPTETHAFLNACSPAFGGRSSKTARIIMVLSQPAQHWGIKGLGSVVSRGSPGPVQG